VVAELGQCGAAAGTLSMEVVAGAASPRPPVDYYR
jgi:hypothetical protein